MTSINTSLEELEAEAVAGDSVLIVAQTTMTVAVVAGIAIVLLLAIAALFVIGVLIDCRSQKLLDEKINTMRRLRLRTRKPSDIEDTGLTNQELGPALSDPPILNINDVV